MSESLFVSVVPAPAPTVAAPACRRTSTAGGAKSFDAALDEAERAATPDARGNSDSATSSLAGCTMGRTSSDDRTEQTEPDDRADDIDVCSVQQPVQAVVAVPMAEPVRVPLVLEPSGAGVEVEAAEPGTPAVAAATPDGKSVSVDITPVHGTSVRGGTGHIEGSDASIPFDVSPPVVSVPSGNGEIAPAIPQTAADRFKAATSSVQQSVMTPGETTEANASRPGDGADALLRFTARPPEDAELSDDAQLAAARRGAASETAPSVRGLQTSTAHQIAGGAQNVAEVAAANANHSLDSGRDEARSIAAAALQQHVQRQGGEAGPGANAGHESAAATSGNAPASASVGAEVVQPVVEDATVVHAGREASAGQSHDQPRGFDHAAEQRHADVPRAAVGIDQLPTTQAIAAPAFATYLESAPLTGAPLTSSAAAAWHVPDQLVRQMHLQWRDGIGHATLRLNPEHLGEVIVEMRVADRGVDATLRAETPAVRAWIEAHRQELAAGLADCGLRLDELRVDTRDDAREERRDAPDARPRRPPRRHADAGEARFEVHA